MKGVIKADARSSRSTLTSHGRERLADGLFCRVINDRLGVEANMATEMSNSINIEPIGGAPMINFDLHAGTVPGGLASGDDNWGYQPQPEAESSTDNVIDSGSMYALPTSFNSNSHFASSSSASSSKTGVFCRDQLLPLSFHVLGEKTHRSTVQTITVSFRASYHLTSDWAQLICVALGRWCPRSDTRSDVHHCSHTWEADSRRQRRS